MGKTGPLFEFDALGELRLRSDAAQTSGESHPAKVMFQIRRLITFLYTLIFLQTLQQLFSIVDTVL